MLFTRGSSQPGQDSEGLFGFYGREVLLQLGRSREKKCRYCSKTGATARCVKKACKVAMHFPCGQEAGATFQFMGKMLVYCTQHRVRQKTEHLPSPPRQGLCDLLRGGGEWLGVEEAEITML